MDARQSILLRRATSLAATALLGLSCGSHREAPMHMAVQEQSAAGHGGVSTARAQMAGAPNGAADAGQPPRSDGIAGAGAGAKPSKQDAGAVSEAQPIAGGAGSSAPAAAGGSGARVSAACGSGHGSCVAKAVAPNDDLPVIPVDSCTGDAEVCVPIEKLADPNYRFPSCTPSIPASLVVPGPNGQLGGCVPLYMVPPEYKASAGQDDCPSAESACSPCNIPFMGETRTGACPAK